MKITKKTKFIEFLNLTNLFNLGEKEFSEILKKVEMDRSKTISGKKIPDNLDKITLGQLVDLQNIKTTEDFIFRPAEIILKLKKERVMECAVYEVFSLVSFVKKEIEKIVKLWDGIKYKPSPEEMQAGINKINHGFFGTADWYARRMGIPDQQTVFDTVSWMKIYMCIKMDNENVKFEKKYREVLNKKGVKK
jgi:hypothetical protein